MSKALNNIDLTTAQRKEVAALLQRYLPDTEVWAYGSRVKLTAKPHSDLDMVAFAAKEQSQAVANLREAFEESYLPFRVDLFVWDEVPEGFHRNIEEARVVVQEKKHSKNSPNNWKILTLSKIINLIGGGTPKRSKQAYWNGNIPWLSVKDFNNQYRYVDSAEETITELGEQESSTRVLKTGQLIISARGTVGALAQLTQPMAFNQSCYGIDAKREYTDNDFLYYLVKHSIDKLKQITHGAVFDTITRETFKHIEVSLPPPPEQKAIAHILGSLDDKIELNRRMNETLEAMAQALFKSWFVDFDPVIDNALAAGNPIPDELKEKARLRRSLGRQAAIRQGLDDEQKSLPDDIRRLFPSEFAYTEEMEWIPKGWEIVKLSDLAVVTMGQSPPSDTYNDDQVGLPFYQGSTDFGFRFPSIRKFCSAPKRQAKKDDVLLSVRAPVGDLNRAEVQCCIGRGLAAIRSKTGYSSWIFYRCRFLKKYFETFNSEGTVFGSMNGADLRAIESVHPCKNILKVYENMTAAIDQSIRLRSGEIDSLSELRDTLLLKLLSGEIRLEKPKQISGG